MKISILENEISALPSLPNPPARSPQSQQIRLLMEFIESRKQAFLEQENPQTPEEKAIAEEKAKNIDISLKAFKIYLVKVKKLPLSRVEEGLGKCLEHPILAADKTFFQSWKNEERSILQLQQWEHDAMSRLKHWKSKVCVNYAENLVTQYEKNDLATLAKELKLLTKPLSKKEAHAYTRSNRNFEQAQKIEVITKLIAYKKAENMIHRYVDMQRRYPDCVIESITMKRHEASNIFHKSFGLNLDTPLTALHHSWMTSQKRTDFHLAQQINGFFIDALHETRAIPSQKVRVFSSSLSRAMETVAHATLPGQNVDHVHISGDFAELKEGLLPKRALSLSADPRGQEKGSAHAREIFTQAGFESVRLDMAPAAFVGKGTDLKTQQRRVYSAAGQLLETPDESLLESATPPLTLTYLVAHGGVIRAMLRKMKHFSRQKDSKFDCTIPRGTIVPEGNLNYGDSYELLVARRIDGSIAAIDYNGKFSRFGEERPGFIMTDEEFKKQTSKTFRKRPSELKKIDNELKALSAFVHGKRGKSCSGLFKVKPIEDWDEYNRKVGELFAFVQTVGDHGEKRNAGLNALEEQLSTYLKVKVPSVPVIHSPEVKAEPTLTSQFDSKF